MSAFYAKVSTPVLSDLAIDFGGVSGRAALSGARSPDLFAGIAAGAGRALSRGRPGAITLTGMVNDQRVTFEYPDQRLADERRR